MSKSVANGIPLLFTTIFREKKMGNLCWTLCMTYIQGEEQNSGGTIKHLNKILNLEALLKFIRDKIIWGDISLGSLCKSLHIILVSQSFNEKRWSIMCCSMLFRVLAEWENDGVNWHLYNCKEKSCNNISKSPANLHYTKSIMRFWILINVYNSALKTWLMILRSYLKLSLI